MKLTAILLFTACLQVSANTYSQTITLRVENAPLDKVVKEIEKQSKFNFFYKEGLFQNANPVTISVSKSTLQQTLDALFSGQPFEYKIVQNTVFVKREKVGNIEVSDPVALIEVKGLVVDESGKPIEGVTVRVKGFNKTTTTDVNGLFSIATVDKAAILIFSHVSMEDLELNVGGRTDLIIKLKTKVLALQDVIINKGYYSTSRRFNTGNVTKVSSETIERQPVSNVLQALQGRVPGLLITQSSGMPGSAIKVQIRGQNSIEKGNDPLYIIDGVPYPAENILRLYNGSPLNYIDPANIESIEVFKDADATAIYGSRGANGVILITTKTGKVGQLKINTNFYYGFARQTNYVDQLNTDEYLQMRATAFQNDGTSPGPADVDANGTWDTNKYTDWQKLLTGKTNHIADGQLALSGGSEYVQYNIGGGVHKEGTVFPGGFNNQRATGHINVTGTSVDKKFGFQLTTNYTSDNNKIPSNDVSSLIGIAPNGPDVYNSNGSLNWANSSWTNPYSYLMIRYNGRVSNLISNIRLNYKLLESLSFKLSLGYTNTQVNEKMAQPISSKDPTSINGTTGSAEFSFRNVHSWIIEPQLNYNQNLFEGKFNFFIGSAIQKNVSEGEYIQANGYTQDNLLGTLSGASTIIGSALNSYQYRYTALFAGVNYNWKDKYQFNLLGRRDGSSRFGPENRFNNFGSAGVAWIFSNESFLKKGLPFLSFGKLRSSIGTTGNDQVGDYSYLDLFYNTNFSYQNAIGLFPANLFNPYLEWELTKKKEAGIELEFFKGKLGLTASYYRNKSSNQLLQYDLPAITGFPSIPLNLNAVVQNEGWEFTINSKLHSKDFQWNGSLNFTLSRSKLLEFPNLENSTYNARLIIGKPINIVKVLPFWGVDPTTGIYQFQDKSGNVTSNPALGIDDIVSVSLDPKYYGGIENSFNYKGIQLDVFFQFIRQTAYNSLLGSNPAGFYNQNIPRYVYENVWQKPGDNSMFQKLTQTSSSNAYQAYTYAKFSEFAYVNSSYMRLKNLSLSYTLSNAFLRKIGIERNRIYLQGQNLLTITSFHGKDPEVQNIYLTAPLKVFTAGIQITF